MREKNRQDSHSVCLWCGKLTNNQNSNKEHIFPVAIGGKKTLSFGSVCTKCNGRLSFLDKALKYCHESMMDAFQADAEIRGRFRGKDDRERKAREKTQIAGKGEAKEKMVSRKGSEISLLNPDFTVTSLTFVKALHKCSANILCYNYGSAIVRQNMKLLTFVNEGKDMHPWSYAVSYANPFKRPLISDPMPVLVQAGHAPIVGFLHSSGIWITSTEPFLLEPHKIEAASEVVAEKIINDNNGDEALTCFGFNYESRNRDSIGKLKFIWVVKEIEGIPNESYLYLLTKCRLCGQTNSTGILLSRDIICNGDLNNKVSYPKNSWNHYSVDDLRRIGIRADCLDQNKFDNYMNQGMSIPIVNDVRK